MLDDSGLRELLGDDDLAIQMVLTSFLDSSKLIYSDIEKAAAVVDRDALEHAAHKLKSASYSVGATALGDACQKLEDCVCESGEQEIFSLLKIIETQLQEIDAYLTARQ